MPGRGGKSAAGPLHGAAPRFPRKRSCTYRNYRLLTVTIWVIRARSAAVEAALGASPRGPGPPPPSAPLLPQASRRPADRTADQRRRAAFDSHRDQRPQPPATQPNEVLLDGTPDAAPPAPAGNRP